MTPKPEMPMPDRPFVDGRLVPEFHSPSLHAALATAKQIVAHPENRGRRASRMARWVVWQGWQRLVKRPWTLTLHDGVRMICHPHDNTTSLVLKYGLFDAQEMRFLLAWLRPGDTFVDVGANVAPYSLLAAAVRDARVVAFEPGTLARRTARANIDLNGVGGRIALEAAAVSDADGEALLTTDRWATNALATADYPGGLEQVRTITLDSYDAAHGLGDVTLLKVDVEGHEAPVIRGASELISRCRPALIVEINDPVALQRLAHAVGYHAVSYDPRSGSLGGRAWPDAAGGNIILVSSIEDARTRLMSQPRT